MCPVRIRAIEYVSKSLYVHCLQNRSSVEQIVDQLFCSVVYSYSTGPLVSLGQAYWKQQPMVLHLLNVKRKRLCSVLPETFTVAFQVNDLSCLCIVLHTSPVP